MPLNLAEITGDVARKALRSAIIGNIDIIVGIILTLGLVIFISVYAANYYS